MLCRGLPRSTTPPTHISSSFLFSVLQPGFQQPTCISLPKSFVVPEVALFPRQQAGNTRVYIPLGTPILIGRQAVCTSFTWWMNGGVRIEPGESEFRNPTRMKGDSRLWWPLIVPTGLRYVQKWLLTVIIIQRSKQNCPSFQRAMCPEVTLRKDPPAWITWSAWWCVCS